jgi:hypothetical protein
MTALNELPSREGDGLEHFRMLYKVLSEELGDTFKEINVLLANQSITYKSLWAIFRNEDIVTSVDGFGQAVALNVLDGTYVSGDEPGFVLSCNYIDTDGTGFGLVCAARRIPPFKGTRKISTLGCTPMRFLPPPAQREIGERLVERGLWREVGDLRSWFRTAIDIWTTRVWSARIQIKRGCRHERLVSNMIFLAT